MSRSTEEKLVRPTDIYMEWKQGQFRYWNKEEKKNIEMPLPVKFLTVDTLSTIKGWSDSDESGIWSNEVRDIGKDELIVRTKKGILKQGLYKDIKDAVKNAGGKYCQSVYIALIEGETLKLCNIQMMGAALTSWIEFNKDNDIYSGMISVNSFIEQGKAIKYKAPVFTGSMVSEELNSKALDIDTELQKYLTAYFKNDN